SIDFILIHAPRRTAILAYKTIFRTVHYDNNTRTNAGSQQATATLTGDNHETLELDATLTIEKATATITADDEQFRTYDGTRQDVAATLNHTETTLAYAPQQGYTQLGDYYITITAGETANYLSTSKTVRLVIESPEWDDITFDGASFTYDGTAHSIFVSRLPADATVTYTGNAQTDAGVYEVTATVSMAGHTDLELTATMTIGKAEIIGIRLEDGIFVYDGSGRSLAIAGDLPGGTTVSYMNNARTDAGSQQVTATITGANYETLVLEATLTIEKAAANITADDEQFRTYDGTQQNVAAMLN